MNRRKNTTASAACGTTPSSAPWDTPYGSEPYQGYSSLPPTMPQADAQPAPSPSRARRIVNRIANVLTTIIFLAALAFTVLMVATTLSSKGGEATFFGWKPYIVLSESMQTEFQVGDIAVSRTVDTSTLQEGDIITFESIDPDNYGEIYTHKIRERTTYEGQSAFITYGTTTGDDDLYPALESKVVGEYVFAIPKAGFVFDFFKSPAGYVVLVLIPFSILIGLQIRNIVRLVKEGRAEQSAALVAEQARVREMQTEIDRLRKGDRRSPQMPDRSALPFEPLSPQAPRAQRTSPSSTAPWGRVGATSNAPAQPQPAPRRASHARPSDLPTIDLPDGDEGDSFEPRGKHGRR